MAGLPSIGSAIILPSYLHSLLSYRYFANDENDND